ncbi:hypothetical protein K4V17_10465 [Staphylococcus epidermidis]|nr:hypothetical protein [Staphylococcus epidermidis]
MNNMKVLVIYFDESDSSVLKYVKDITSDILVYTPDEKISYIGYENIHGNILEILDKIKGTVDVIALKKRENYPVGDKFIGNLIETIKSKDYKVLVIQ